jgi:hemerythrin HHE cation binding domain-containing protein
MTDIITVVLADHARIRRLLKELTAECEPRSRLATLWAELAWLLEAHVDAAREITYLPLTDIALRRNMREAADDDADIREAVAEAKIHRAGSARWRLAFRAVEAAADRYIDVTESGLLPMFRQQMSEQTRLALGQQWIQLMDARRRDSQSVPYSETGERGTG